MICDLATPRRLAPARYWPYAAAAAGVLAWRYAVLGGVAPLAITASSNPLVNAGAAARILTATKVLGKYLWLLIYPVPLSADYSFNQIPLVGSPMDPWFLLSALALASIVAGTLWSWRRAPALFLCGAFFVATFSLTSNFLRPIGTIMGERLLYLPSLGFTCAVAYALARAQQQPDQKQIPRFARDDKVPAGAQHRPQRRNIAIAAGALLALLYAGRTVARNSDWKDQLALFSSAAAVSPNSSLVQANLAGALLQKGDFQGAAEHALAAIRIEPGDPAAHMILGEAYQRLGDLPRAADAYASVERLAPGTAGGQEAARRRQAILRRLGQH